PLQRAHRRTVQRRNPAGTLDPYVHWLPVAVNVKGQVHAFVWRGMRVHLVHQPVLRHNPAHVVDIPLVAIAEITASAEAYCSSTRLRVESCVVLPYLPVLAKRHHVACLLHRLRLLLRGRVRTLFWLWLGFYRFGNFDGLGLRLGKLLGLRFRDSRRLVGDDVLCRRLSW